MSLPIFDTFSSELNIYCLLELNNLLYHNDITFCCPEIQLKHVREPYSDSNVSVINSGNCLNREFIVSTSICYLIR
jgi:hypothetical protein